MNSTEHDRHLRLAIVRTLAAPIDRKFYNSQELGLGAALTSLSFDVDVFVAGKHQEMKESVIPTSGSGQLRLLETPFHTIPSIRQALMPVVRKRVAKESYDFVQVNESNELESWLLTRTARRHGIPVALYQGMYKPIAGRVQNGYQAIFDRVCLPGLAQSVSLPLAKTNRAAGFLARRGFTDAQVLPVGLDPSPFLDEQPVDWHQQLDIPSDHRLLTYVGNLEPRRRPDLIVDLATRMQGEPIAFVMAGTGELEDSVQELIRQRSLTNLHLTGRIPQARLPSLYRDSSLLLLPSTYEIYGMVVLEAMYFGLPVVSNRTAGPESIIESGKDGWLVDDLETETWMTAVTRALQSPARLREVGNAATTKIRTELTWDHVAMRYAKAVRRIIARRDS